MKIIKKELVKKRKNRSKFLKRIGVAYYKFHPEPKISTYCINTDHFNSYEELKNFVIGLKVQGLPICLFGDARFAPLPFPIYRYYLKYNKDNFFGEENMRLYDENAYLTFQLNYPEDFDKYKFIMHRSIYLGSLAHILLICRGEAVLPRKKAVEEDVTDYNVIMLKDTDQYLPHHDKLKSFTQSIPRKI